jgi:hypothetical protein
MSFHDYLRIFIGLVAVVGAVFLVHGIVTRRLWLGGSIVTPSPDLRTFWLLVARHACTFVGMALVATVVPEKLFVPVFVLALFAPALAFALLTGRFEWEADDKRIDSPHRFWRWVAFYAFMCLLMGAFALIELFSAKAP